MAEGENIISINIEEEMKTAYIDYSMSVIVARAIPDVRDGLKPVHRRVLYAMQDLGLYSNRSYKKSARIVGEVLGKYHPHGDSSVYDAMVRMAQEWSLRYPLVDGQGNFGSVDGDSPAAMRYTEARLKKIAEEMLADIDKDTVDFGLNFDDTLKEPVVLPSRIPALLVNGASGIAVGMATNILPHNLNEVINGTIAYIEDNDITVEGLMQYVKAPDFPTGGTIFGYEGVKEAFMTGRGKVVVRGKAEIVENEGGKDKIIVTEIPYQVNKASLIIKAADLVNDKKIEGISDIRDESDRKGMRIVFDLKRDANADVVLNKLYNYTPLQTSYGVNNIALVKGRPQLINLKDFIENFVEFRHEIVVRRTKYELAEAEKKAHILEGLLIALDNLDAVIKLIRNSETPDIAKDGLISNFKLSEIQAKAILEMRLQRLTGLERDKIKKDYEELMKLIEHLKEILADESLRMKIIQDELLEVQKKYGDERRTDIIMSGDDINIEDLIADEDFVITISHLGYIKRTPIDEYRTQNRGGRGSRGGKTREEDFIEYIFIASAHQFMLFFTDQGQVYWLRVYEIPEGTKTSKGRPIQNLVNIPKEDKVNTFINVRSLDDEEALDNQFVVLCTKKGIIKKTTLRAYSRPRVTGIRAINVRDGDQLLAAKLTDGTCDIMMAKKSGKSIRFPESKVRPMGRTASGVRGVKLGNDKDEVVGMICVTKEEMDFAIKTNQELEAYYEKKGADAELPEELAEAVNKMQTIMVVAEKGYGKRSDIEEYRITNRGGVGVKTINITDKTGSLIAIKNVTNEDDVMIINKSGITIRMALDNVRVMGRATQGVRLIKLDDNDEIASVAKVAYVNGTVDEEAVEEGEEGTEPAEDVKEDAKKESPKNQKKDKGSKGKNDDEKKED